MKIEGHITAAEDRGDTLKLTAQARRRGAATWQPYLSIDLNVPASDLNKRTYHLGRDIKLTLEPA